VENVNKIGKNSNIHTQTHTFHIFLIHHITYVSIFLMGKQTIYRNLHFSSLHLTCFSFQQIYIPFFIFSFSLTWIQIFSSSLTLLLCNFVVMDGNLSENSLSMFCFNLKVFQAYTLMKVYCNHRYIILHLFILLSWEFWVNFVCLLRWWFVDYMWSWEYMRSWGCITRSSKVFCFL
jgi:hypothetical protein